MDAQRPRLLIVDDDQAIVRLVAGIAAGEGFEVATTSAAAAALVQLLDRPADLVLVDHSMPGVDRVGCRALNPRRELALQGCAHDRHRHD